MALSEDYIKAVDSGDVTMARIMMSDCMLVDLTLHDFEERLRYAERKLPTLYDPHDGEIFPNDMTTWNKSLLDEQMVKVVTNFSRERIAFLKKLVRHVYAGQAQKEDTEVFIKEHKSIEITPKKIGVGLAACGAVVTVVGLATSTTALTVTGAAVLVAGGIVIVSSKK